MATLSHLSFSIPSLNFRTSRRVNRKSGVAFATMNKETVGVRVAEGEGNLPKVVLTSAGGSEADIYLFGGCVTSWKVSNGKDLLFVRPDAVFNKKKPISGGVPHCFPQFGPGPMQQHGFARNLDWSILDSENVEGNPVITLELKDGSYSRAMWDFSFRALYKVILNTKSISTELTITNTDNKPFSFSSALHTYFSDEKQCQGWANSRRTADCKRSSPKAWEAPNSECVCEERQEAGHHISNVKSADVSRLLGIMMKACEP